MGPRVKDVAHFCDEAFSAVSALCNCGQSPSATHRFWAICFAILVPFVVIPEVLERRGYEPRSRLVRGIVWASFLLIVFVPAIASGFVFSVSNIADWLLFVVAMAVAILYDYYRLNPDKVPWARARA
jgi:hypothetical protein